MAMDREEFQQRPMRKNAALLFSAEAWECVPTGEVPAA